MNPCDPQVAAMARQLDKEIMAELKAGRELDALVAERLGHGLRWPSATESGDVDRWVVFEHTKLRRPLPHYSSEVAAAWEVREHVSALGLGEMLIRRTFDNKWNAYQATGCADPDFGDWWVIGDTAPHAICLAALKAVA